MKINISKNELLSKLRVVGKIIKPSSQQVTYNSFLIKVESEKSIQITGSDEQGRIETTVACNIENFEEKSFLVDSTTILNGLKELPDQPITIEVNEVKLVVKYSVGKFELAVGDANLYPDFNIGDKGIKCEIGRDRLYDGLKSVTKYTLTDDTLRPVMTAVNFANSGDAITFAASTGHVLAVYEIENKDNQYLFNINLPNKISKIITELPATTDESIQFVVAGNHVRFIIGEYTVSSRLIEGSYPNFRSVIPRDSELDMIINTSELIAAINRVSVFSDEALSMIVLDIKDNTITLSAENMDYSRSAKETLMLAEVYKPLKIGFKSSFLVDVLKTVSTETNECELHFSGPNRAAVIRPKDSKVLTMILMPMMVNQ